jgi:hypothetical protein
MILDVVLWIDIDMGGSLGGFPPYKVGVPVFDQSEAKMIESALVREFSFDSDSNGLLDHIVPAELKML